MRCRDASWALKAEREGKDVSSLAEARLFVTGEQAILKAAKGPLYLQ